jgi:hypothetical protein
MGTVVTAPAVTMNGELTAKPGIVTVPDVFVVPVMKRFKVGLPAAVLALNINQKSVPLLSRVCAWSIGAKRSRAMNISATVVTTDVPPARKCCVMFTP